MTLTTLFFAGEAKAQNPAEWSAGVKVLDQGDLSTFTDSGPEQPSVVGQLLPGGTSKRLVMAVSALTDETDTNCPDGVYEVFLYSSTDGETWSELVTGPVVGQTTINGNFYNDLFTCGAKTPHLMTSTAANKLFLVVEGMQRTDQCAVYSANNQSWLYGCNSSWSAFAQGSLVFNMNGDLVPSSSGNYFRDIGFSWDAFEESEGLSAVWGPDGPVVFYEDGGEVLSFRQLAGGFWTSPTAVLSPDDFGTSWDDDEVFNPSATCSPSGYINLHVGGRTTSGGVGGPITSAGWLSALSGDLGYTFDLGSTQFLWSDDEEWRSWDTVRVGPFDHYVTYYDSISPSGTHEIYMATTLPTWSVNDVQDDACEPVESCWRDVAAQWNDDDVTSLKVDGTFSVTHGTVNSLPSSGYFSQIDAGDKVICGIDEYSAVQCFSDFQDTHGILASMPTTGEWEQVEVASTFACARDAAGAVQCWGSDTYDQVTDAPTGNGYKDVATGIAAACAIDSNDELACWGRDNENQVSGAPTGTYSDVSCGRHYCVAVDATDGHLETWGNPTVMDVVNNVPTATGFVSVSAGKLNALALDGAGNMTAWGSDQYDLVTDVSAGGVYEGVTWRMAEMTELVGCGIVDDPNGVTGLSSGDVQCWGDQVNHSLAREDAADGCL